MLFQHIPGSCQTVAGVDFGVIRSVAAPLLPAWYEQSMAGQLSHPLGCSVSTAMFSTVVWPMNSEAYTRLAQHSTAQHTGSSAPALPAVLASLPHVVLVWCDRLFLVGFPPEWLADGAVLSRPIKAAKQLVDGVYSSPMALQDLVQDLGLQPVPSRPSSPSILPSGTPQHGTAPGSPLPDGRAAAPRQGSAELDLTGGPADSVFRVLLLPDHFDSQQLQQLLGTVPLWQLLASPVAVFRQGPDQGLLQQLSRQQRRLQKQQQGADAGSSGVLQLLPCAAWRQVYRNGLAVVVDSTTLQHSSTEDIQQLLQLLHQAQEQQRVLQAEAKGLVEVGGWQLLLLQQHLEALSADKQELLRRCAAHNT